MSVNIIKHLVAVEELDKVVNSLNQVVSRLTEIQSKLNDVASKANQATIIMDIRSAINMINDVKVKLDALAKDSTLGSILSKLGELAKDASVQSIIGKLGMLESILESIDMLAKEGTLQSVLNALQTLNDVKSTLQSIQIALGVLSTLSRLDVDISTRASESTLTTLLNTLLSLITTSGNIKASIIESAIKVPTDIQDHWSESITILASGTRTSSGSGSDIDVARFMVADVCVDVTGVSGTTPTLSVYVEGRIRAIGKYRVLCSFENITSSTTLCCTINPLSYALVRARWVISGTSPSFTFSVVGEFKS